MDIIILMDNNKINCLGWLLFPPLIDKELLSQVKLYVIGELLIKTYFIKINSLSEKVLILPSYLLKYISVDIAPSSVLSLVGC